MCGARLWISLFGFAAVGLISASLGLVSNGWFEADYTTTTGNTKMVVGPIEFCVNGGCNFNPYSTQNFASCSRDGTTQAARGWSVFSLAVLAGVIAIVGDFVASCGAFVVTASLYFFGTVCGAAAIGLWYNTMFQWLYCGGDFCSQQTGATSCSTKLWTIGFILMVCGTGVLLLGSILSTIVAVHRRCKAQQPPPTQPAKGDATAVPMNGAAAPDNVKRVSPLRVGPTGATPQPGQAATPAPVTGEDKEVAEVLGASPARAAPAATGECEEVQHHAANDDEQGDWVWDEDSQMYWSDSAGLYLDWESGWYYDASSQCWYDPEKGEWVDDTTVEGKPPKRQS